MKHNLAPAGAIIPEQISQSGLWALDVDDTIWQDIGLEDDPDPLPPLWLIDDKVRAGIRHLLEFDHCLEEEDRLRREHVSLQVLARDEWAVLSTAITSICASVIPLASSSSSP